MGDSGASSPWTSSSSVLARMGDRRPLTVLEQEWVRERKSVHASSSSLLRAGAAGPLGELGGTSRLGSVCWPPGAACRAAFFLRHGRGSMVYLLLLSMKRPAAGVPCHSSRHPVDDPPWALAGPLILDPHDRLCSDRLCRIEFCRERRDNADEPQWSNLSTQEKQLLIWRNF